MVPRRHLRIRSGNKAHPAVEALTVGIAIAAATAFAARERYSYPRDARSLYYLAISRRWRQTRERFPTVGSWRRLWKTQSLKTPNGPTIRERWLQLRRRLTVAPLLRR